MRFRELKGASERVDLEGWKGRRRGSGREQFGIQKKKEFRSCQCIVWTTGTHRGCSWSQRSGHVPSRTVNEVVTYPLLLIQLISVDVAPPWSAILGPVNSGWVRIIAWYARVVQKSHFTPPLSRSYSLIFFPINSRLSESNYRAVYSLPANQAAVRKNFP